MSATIYSTSDNGQTEEILTVSQLTDRLSSCLESYFPFVWVRGEITNWSQASSGHIYFTLKDSRSQLQCVWFKGKRKKARGSINPVTGEINEGDLTEPEPQNGLACLCAGGLGIYAARGQYQLLVEYVQPAGAGLLALEFEKCKRRLAMQGFFDQERKKPIPYNPSRIALITSAHGAAVHDFMELASKRGLGATIRLFNVPVQGADAAAKIALAIRAANAQNWAEVIVVIRGGGSLEDLWAFNEEPVACAIYESKLPVVTGIGHEVDTSIADLTADLRAATPSHAAQLLWPLRRDLWQRLDELAIYLCKLEKSRLQASEKSLAHNSRLLGFLSPLAKIGSREASCATLTHRLRELAANMLAEKQNRLKTLADFMAKGEITARKISMGQHNCAWLAKNMAAALSSKLAASAMRLEYAEKNLFAMANGNFSMMFHKWEALSKRLQSLDPDLPLRKGYAMLFAEGELARSVKNITIGESITVRLHDGEISATVTAIKNKSKETNYDKA